jgi:hypothetical protein
MIAEKTITVTSLFSVSMIDIFQITSSLLNSVYAKFQAHKTVLKADRLICNRFWVYFNTTSFQYLYG